MFTPIITTLTATATATELCMDDNNDRLYKNMDIDTADITGMDDTYQTIHQRIESIDALFANETISDILHALPKGNPNRNKKFIASLATHA